MVEQKFRKLARGVRIRGLEEARKRDAVRERV